MWLCTRKCLRTVPGIHHHPSSLEHCHIPQVSRLEWRSVCNNPVQQRWHGDMFHHSRARSSTWPLTHRLLLRLLLKGSHCRPQTGCRGWCWPSGGCTTGEGDSDGNCGGRGLNCRGECLSHKSHQFLSHFSLKEKLLWLIMGHFSLQTNNLWLLWSNLRKEPQTMETIWLPELEWWHQSCR